MSVSNPQSPHDALFQRAASSAIVMYLVKVTRRKEDEVLMAIRKAVRSSDYDDIMNAGLNLEERGIERGQRTTLLRLLQLRFGELPSWAKRQLEASDTAAMDEIAERLLVAPTLAEALARPLRRRRPSAPSQHRRSRSG